MSSVIDFNGDTLIVATNQSPPYVFLEYNPTNNSWHFTGGFEYMLLMALSKYFNFTYNVVNCSSDWGVLLKNNTWTGIIGEIHYKKADLGFSGLTITEERSHAVYFAEPHIITSVSFLTPPPGKKRTFSLFIEPFEPTVWIAIFAAFLLMSCSHALLSRIVSEAKIANFDWQVMSYLLRQPLARRLPRLNSVRILLSGWLLASLVLSTIYGGYIYSLMSIIANKHSIDSLSELADAQHNGLIHVVAIKGSSYFESLKKEKYGIHAKIGKLLKSVKDKNEGLSIVRNSKEPYAYISTRDHLMFGMLTYGPDAYHLPPTNEDSTIFIDMMSIAMQKDFQYKFEFNQFISNIKKGGLVDYWRYREHHRLIQKNYIKANYQQDMITTTDSKHTFNHLSLQHMQSSFQLFIIGSITSILALIFEFFINSPLFQRFKKLLRIDCIK